MAKQRNVARRRWVTDLGFAEFADVRESVRVTQDGENESKLKGSISGKLLFTGGGSGIEEHLTSLARFVFATLSHPILSSE